MYAAAAAAAAAVLDYTILYVMCSIIARFACWTTPNHPVLRSAKCHNLELNCECGFEREVHVESIWFLTGFNEVLT